MTDRQTDRQTDNHAVSRVSVIQKVVAAILSRHMKQAFQNFSTLATT